MKFGELPFHPVLFAAHPVLALHASNVALVPVAEIWLPIALSCSAAVSLAAVIALAARDVARGARIAAAVTTAFFLFGPVQDAVASVSSPVVGPNMTLVFALWGACLVVLTVLAGWKWKEGRRINSLLNITGALMCALAGGQIVAAHVSTSSRVEGTLGSNRAIEAKRPARLPDVFYIVLDGYGRDDVLREVYNSTWSLADGLESRGFFVAHDARTNYVQTQLSIASTLNLLPVQRLLESTGSANWDRLAMDKLIDKSAVARSFKSMGYKTIAVTTGFPALTFESADVWISDDRGRSLFVDALLHKTPIRSSGQGVEGLYDSRRRRLQGAFREFERLAKPGSSPKFVIVHVLAPHPPFVFGPDGEPRNPDKPYMLSDGSHFVQSVGTVDEYRRGYRDQAEYIGKLTIEAIDELFAASSDAVVIVQGDHGPKCRLDQESAEKTDMGEVLPILSAYRVPEDVRRELYAGITPVNSFRALFRGLFGMDLPNQEDKSYYSPWSAPMDFVEVSR